MATIRTVGMPMSTADQNRDLLAAVFASVQTGDTVVFPANQTYPIDSSDLTNRPPDFDLGNSRTSPPGNVHIQGNGCTIQQAQKTNYGFLRIWGNNCIIEGLTITGTGAQRTPPSGNGTYFGYPSVNRAAAVMLIGSGNIVRDMTFNNLQVAVNLRGPVIAPSGTPDYGYARYDYTAKAVGNALLNLTVNGSDFGVTGTQQDHLVIDRLHFDGGTWYQYFPPHSIYIFENTGVPTDPNVPNVASVSNVVVSNLSVTNSPADEAIKINHADTLSVTNFSVDNSCGGITIGEGKNVLIAKGSITNNFSAITKTSPYNSAGTGIWLEHCDGVTVSDITITPNTGVTTNDSLFNGVLSQGGSRNVTVENVAVSTKYNITAAVSPFRVVGHNAYGSAEMHTDHCSHSLLSGGAPVWTHVNSPPNSTLTYAMDFPDALGGPSMDNTGRKPLAFDGFPGTTFLTTAVRPIDYAAFSYNSTTGVVTFTSGPTSGAVIVFMLQFGSEFAAIEATYTPSGSATLRPGATNVWGYVKGSAREIPTPVQNMVIPASSPPVLTATAQTALDTARYTFNQTAGTVTFSTLSGVLDIGDSVTCHWWDNGLACSQVFTVAATQSYLRIPPVGTANLVIYNNTKAAPRQITAGSDYVLDANGFVRFISGGNIGAHDKVVLTYKRDDAGGRSVIDFPVITGNRGTNKDVYNYPAASSLKMTLDTSLIQNFTTLANFYQGQATASHPTCIVNYT